MLLCFGAAAQDARFKPASIGVTLDNPSYLVDFNSASGTARWVHYELQGGETSGGASRTDDFRTDRRVAWNSPSASATDIISMLTDNAVKGTRSVLGSGCLRMGFTVNSVFSGFLRLVFLRTNETEMEVHLEHH